MRELPPAFAVSFLRKGLLGDKVKCHRTKNTGMAVCREKIAVKTQSGIFVDITDSVRDVVAKSEIGSGICSIAALGSTAAILVNENEPDLLEDIKNVLEDVASSKKIWTHPENAHSHIRAILLGSEKSIPVENSDLILGTYQRIFILENDVRDRKREIVITIVCE